MPPDLIKQSHRPGPLKQSNKPHKGGSNKKKNNRGRTDVKTASVKQKLQLSRMGRKNQLNQIRKAKREEVLKQKGRLGGLESSPILVTILSLDTTVDPANLLDDLKSCEEDLDVSQNVLGHWHISCPRLKQRFTFLTPKTTDLHSVMDALKVSEILLLLHSSEALDEYTDMLLSVIMGHALPTTLHVVKGMDKLNPKKKADLRKTILKNIEARFPEAKLHHADSAQELQLLFRQIGSQKQRPVSFRDNRPHLIAEDVQFEQSDPDSGKGTLQVCGYIRGQALSVNGLVHIPGWDTYQMSRLDMIDDPHSSKRFEMHDNISMLPDPHLQESLQSEVVPDPMEGEQTWPTQEELDEADLRPKKTVRKVAEGISDYQASWIVDLDDGSDFSDDESGSDNEMAEDDNEEDHEENMDDTESVATNMKDDNYDKNLDMDEERQTLVRFKEERTNQMFPDEQDTPMDVSARVRYQRYRGLKNFKTCTWDPMENLPLEYAKIYRFQNFRQTKKKILTSMERDGPEPGTYVRLHIADVPKAVYDSISEGSITVVYGLLPHEQKMSVVNTAIRKHASCKVPIKSKDKLIFHVGFRRFTCNPIFSEHTNGNKFKFERFLPDGVVIASFYAPVTFPPASVVVFRQKQNGSHELVATGSVVDTNPNRIVVKRVVLSGHPFRISKRTVVVRYMFFNREDINWFKCVELKTKCGRRGHIRESLGSHGHMKCTFDEQLQSQDVVLMCLYKRVFPKWTYDSYVPTPVCKSTVESNVEEMLL